MKQLIESMEKTLFGQSQNIKLLIAALLAGGHVLLEGVPGLGKTKMARTLAELIQGQYRRIQFTPDMMPSDITGNVVFNMKENDFQMVKGPIFCHLLLADEINRTGPKTQAALLEAMEERQTTIHGETYRLADPFFVVATQNPVEYEGTYPLPEAQLDRFMFKLLLDYPSADSEKMILQRHIPFSNEQVKAIESVCTLEQIREKRKELAQVVVEDSIVEYITAIIRKTRELPQIQLGASPRAGIAVMMASKAWALLDGRSYVTPDDVKLISRPALRHRIILSPQAELEGATRDQIIQEALASIPVPR
ncbi:MAG: MoxR family ATPase [Bacilli bacterium]|jgi:MoxR-like ATPase|nr:MoxR family ATPase [Bacilli bacterium]